MRKRIEVYSQAEFDACVRAGNIAIAIGCRVVARENSRVEAWENSRVVAWENSSVVAWGNSSVEAWENSSVVARGNSRVEARGNSSVEAWENSSVVARENSSVVAWENSSVEARENSSVVARGNVFVRLFGALSVKASAHVVVMKHGNAKPIEGGRQVDAFAPSTPAEWCEHHGVEVQNGVAVLFKGVNDQFRSERGGIYEPGSAPVAPDWDEGKRECGGGLHFSPTSAMTKEFAPEATKWIACPVALSDMRAPRVGDICPNKIKARGCCAAIWEVDSEGRALKTAHREQS